jgi:hypothetical protein
VWCGGPNLDKDKQNGPEKNKNLRIACFEELVVLSGRQEAFSWSLDVLHGGLKFTSLFVKKMFSPSSLFFFVNR